MEDREIRKVLDVLDNAGIRYRMVSHDPVYTIEEMERLHLDADAEIAKNLFLRDARGKRHFLVVLCSCKTVDLKALRGQLGTSALSFASEDRLKRFLGLEKGAVTPLGIPLHSASIPTATPPPSSWRSLIWNSSSAATAIPFPSWPSEPRTASFSAFASLSLGSEVVLSHAFPSIRKRRLNGAGSSLLGKGSPSPDALSLSLSYMLEGRKEHGSLPPSTIPSSSDDYSADSSPS